MTTVATASLTLRDLVPRVRGTAGFAEVCLALASQRRAGFEGTWGSATALVAAALTSDPGVDPPTPPIDPRFPPPVLVVVLPRMSLVDDFAVDLAGLWGSSPSVFRAWESLPRDLVGSDPVLSGRLRVLRELQRPLDGAPKSDASASTGRPGRGVASRTTATRSATGLGRLLKGRGRKAGSSEDNNGEEAPAAGPPAVARPQRVVVTSIEALLQPVPSQDEIARTTRRFSVGDQLDPVELCRTLVKCGLERVAGIELPGEFTQHGGIVDLFPPSEPEPLRIEFFGDEIESIRRFDPRTQRKTFDLKTVELTLSPKSNAVDRGSPDDTDSPSGRHLGDAHFADWLPPGSWILFVELSDAVQEGGTYLRRLGEPRGLYTVDGTLAKLKSFGAAVCTAFGDTGAEAVCRLAMESVNRFDVPARRVMEELAAAVSREERVLIACHNAAEMQRLTELLSPGDLLASGRVSLCEGHLLRGFHWVSERLTVLSDHALYGRRDIRRAAPAVKAARIESRAIDSFLELNVNDYVVHLTKGIAQYLGMKLLDRNGQTEENLILRFAGNALVYVPSKLIHLVQKYVGGANSVPSLSSLKSTSWERKKAAAAEAVADLASDMLRMQATRAAKPGFAFPADSHLQEEFDAAFPYTPTVDQVSAIAAIKADMQLPQPMDRLICGDVGYGKTEVAMRAAFKAIDSGKQVAVLVPTTVLAEQHFRTFSERMAEYPVNIEVLSRFRTRGEQRKILEGLATGGVDLVIGTHRIVQSDVRFRDLGLLIIDEEQRFGVEAKELLKKMRLEVDVLTLSATPIPRTLHMSLLGIRDISNLTTPPLDRNSIETRVCRFDPELIRHAIVREMNRGGQVYFVHNRVYNIERVAEEIRAIVPDARVAIVHGQMHEDDIESGMVQFVSGQADVLVATTIIESGLDIPNANTIFIHQADSYGLSEMHQLRGRVGRYKHKAYCYLILEGGKPLAPQASKRLKAIEEFSELGAGFKIAMRDLEIRGAGNILGIEQSGHIVQVGYELYCQLLENAVRQLQGKPIHQARHVTIDLPVTAYIPEGYVPSAKQKIDVYRKLSVVTDDSQLEELREELRDRFGPPPRMVEELFRLHELQILARKWEIDDIHLEDDDVVFEYRNRGKIHILAKLAGSRFRVVDHKSAYWSRNTKLDASMLVTSIKALLQRL